MEALYIGAWFDPHRGHEPNNKGKPLMKGLNFYIGRVHSGETFRRLIETIGETRAAACICLYDQLCQLTATLDRDMRGWILTPRLLPATTAYVAEVIGMSVSWVSETTCDLETAGWIERRTFGGRAADIRRTNGGDTADIRRDDGGPAAEESPPQQQKQKQQAGAGAGEEAAAEADGDGELPAADFQSGGDESAALPAGGNGVMQRMIRLRSVGFDQATARMLAMRHSDADVYDSIADYEKREKKTTIRNPLGYLRRLIEGRK